MSELSGLELRKAALECLGWIFGATSDGSRLHSATKRGSGTKQFHANLDSLLACLPAIESGSAVSESLFLEWIKAKYYWWDINQSGWNSEVICEVWTDGMVWRGAGTTPSEARARAIVAAKERA